MGNKPGRKFHNIKLNDLPETWQKNKELHVLTNVCALRRPRITRKHTETDETREMTRKNYTCRRPRLKLKTKMQKSWCLVLSCTWRVWRNSINLHKLWSCQGRILPKTSVTVRRIKKMGLKVSLQLLETSTISGPEAINRHRKGQKQN